LEDVDAVHVYGPQFKTNFDFSPYGEDAEQRFDAAHGPRSYPLVIEHPETGRRSLYLSPVYTAAIEGLSRNESRTLLRFLFRHITDQAFVFRHHWSIDDLVVWDELVTLHLAPQDFRPKPRRLIRVAGGRVTPAAPSRR
jgi:taurine dioxygenase